MSTTLTGWGPPAWGSDQSSVTSTGCSVSSPVVWIEGRKAYITSPHAYLAVSHMISGYNMARVFSEIAAPSYLSENGLIESSDFLVCFNGSI